MTVTPPSCLTVYVGPPWGGCYERLLRLVKSVLRRGWTVHYVGTVPPEPHPALIFHPVKVRGRGNPSLGTLAAGAAAASGICFRKRIRLLWTFGAVYSALLAPLALLPGRRLVTFLRGSLVEQERATGAGRLRCSLARMAERMAAEASDRVVTVSHELARRAGVEAVVLPNDLGPLDLQIDAHRARLELGLPVGAFLVGYAGGITPIKSLECLVDAVVRVPEARLVLAGFSAEETAYQHSLRQRVAKLRLTGRAHLLPWTPDVRRLLPAFDLVALPSRHEGCPNLLLEAMAAGRPCLGARAGGIEELLLHDELLFPANDVEALASRLRQLAASGVEREKVAALCRARAEAFRFDWEARACSILEESFGLVPS